MSKLVHQVTWKIEEVSKTKSCSFYIRRQDVSKLNSLLAEAVVNKRFYNKTQLLALGLVHTNTGWKNLDGDLVPPVKYSNLLAVNVDVYFTQSR